MQKKWCLAAHKSGRRTVRRLEQPLAAVVEGVGVGVVAAAVAAAVVRVREEPWGWAWRAGAATAYLDIG